MIRLWLRILPLLLLIACCILMLEESPILTEPVIEGLGLPLGTLIAWVGITMFPFSILIGIRLIRKPISVVYRFYHRAFILLTLLATPWGLVSYLLAGNWAITFSNSDGFRGSEQAFSVFLYYTAFVISLTLLFIIIFAMHHLIINQKNKR